MSPYTARLPDRLCLVVSTTSGVTVAQLRPSSTLSLGRAAEADVTIVHPSVSRIHARLVVSPTRVTLMDLSSSFGTRVGERRLLPNEEVSLELGASFELGSTTLTLQASDAIGDAPAEAPAFDPTRAAIVAGTVVRDAGMQRLYALVSALAPSPLGVLLLGETGVGKEVLARGVHKLSQRANKPFVAVNCAAIPASLIEGELFGYEKGAFTGADRARAGLLESADGGTLFLDEVGEIPIEIQVKLLRALEDKGIRRLGRVETTRVDVRIVSATNRDLAQAIADSRFRSDLHFRLNGVTITIPPLRKRPDDILPLAEHFAAEVASRLGRPGPAIAPSAAAALQRHSWPGNVRELKNVVERAVVMCAASVLDAGHLVLGDAAVTAQTVMPPQTEARIPSVPNLPHIPGPSPLPNEHVSEGRLRSAPVAPRMTPAEAAAESGPSLRAQLEAYERQAIVNALEETAGNQTRAAERLGLSRRVLIQRMDDFELSRPRARKKK